MQKNKNILSIILILLVNSSILIFADPPNWDENGDGVIDNYSFYENNGSITSKVYNNDEDVGTLGDMVGAFVNGGLRGVGIASEIPSFLGSGYAFLSMIYSNATSGETITFQYYSQSDDEIYYLLETEEFVSNMIIGDVTNPFYLSYTTNSDIVDPPDWDADNDGVLDNYSDYENNGSITASIIVDNINYIDEGDMIAAFVNGEQRGVGVPTEVPFGPYTGTYQFQMMIYSNQTSGESLNFQFYDSSEGSIYYLLETLEFVTNMIIGDVINPYIFTFNEGDSNDIYGCMDMSACNYNENATTNDGSCEFPEPNYNCNGECIVDFDCLGICGGTANTDLCGICEGDNTSCVGCTDQNACNYDPNALFDNNNCEYPDENFDCFGNCIVEIDCLGQCGGNAEFDCNDVCSGDAFIDVCGNCVGGDTQNEPCSQDCNGDWGGSAFIDNCYNCVDGNTGLNACENYDYSLDLHVGYNLISTYALPVDSNFDFILNNDVNPDDYIYMIIGESSSSYNTGSNIWVGDLHQGFVEQDKGYWISTNNTMILNINNSYDINNDISYNLHEGANLVSFPENGIFNLEDAIPDDFEDGFNAILG